MILDLLFFDEYSGFIWSAFVFTIFSYYSLYLMTIKELKKHEKMFLIETKKLPNTKIEIVKNKKGLQEVLFGSLIN